MSLSHFDRIRNVRIDIQDLIKVARLLGEFKTVAAGSLYATLELPVEQRRILSKQNIVWSFDD